MFTFISTKKVFTIVLLSSSITLFNSVSIASPLPAQNFVPGKTVIENGMPTKYKNACYIAKNNPSSWEIPNVNS